MFCFIHLVALTIFLGKDNASVLPPDYFVVRLKRECIGKATICNKTIGKWHKLQIEAEDCNSSQLKRFNCPFCHLTLSRKSSMNRHILAHTGEKPHTCPACHEGFTRSDKLKVHMQRMHQNY